jgi:hypothetical protein
MTIKQHGGIFGRNPTFNNITVDGALTVDQIVEKTGAAGITLDGVTLKDGNVVLADGKGVDFSATAGTGTSELFDDYEEGTFVATLTGTTAAPTTPVTVTARYVKIGKLVTVNILFSSRNTTGATGKMRITGLPYTSQAGTANTGSPLMFGFNVTNKTAVALIGGNATEIGFYSVADNGPWTEEDISAGITKFFYLSMTYEAA